MSSLISANSDLVTHLGISLETAERVYAFQPRAEKELRALITDDVYDGMITDLPGDDAAALNAKQAAFAEALLALHHSISVLGFRVADEGGLVKSFGMGDYEGQLLSPFQIGQLEKKIYGKAMQSIREFMPTLSELFTNENDRQAQYQGVGFGITATDPNPEAGTVYNGRTGLWE